MPLCSPGIGGGRAVFDSSPDIRQLSVQQVFNRSLSKEEECGEAAR